MRKRTILGLCLAALVVVTLCAIPAVALGDDVDFGGGGDYGGGYDSYDSYSYSYDSGSSGGGGNGGNLGVFVFIGAFVVVVLVNKNKKSGSGGAPGTGAPSAQAGPQRHQASLEELRRVDPKFSEADIEAKVKNWVVMFETSWGDGDMTPCKDFIGEGLFNTYQGQLAMMRQNGERSRTEDLAVMNCSVESWWQDGHKEYLNVWLREKKRTYKVDLNNPGRVIKGDRNTVYHLDYRWQLVRAAGGTTENAGIKVRECPNCGAQNDITESGTCRYCGSAVVADNFAWVLNKVDKLNQTSYRS